MDEQDLDEAATLVQKLADIGGRSNNADLRKQTSWDAEKYFSVRKQCIAAGLVGVGRGRGGIVFLTDTAKSGLPASLTPTDAESVKKETEEAAKEVEYYKKLLPTIQADWVQSENFDVSVVEITAAKRVKGAGRWTVPDIVVIGKTVHQYVPGLTFTVQSLEVKRFEAADATSVFEALHHRRSAHFCYLVIVNYPKSPKAADSDRLAQLTQICEEHGVGLVVVNAGQEAKYENWEFPFEAFQRHEPDPYTLDGFIKRYLSPEARDAVAKMVR